MNRLGMLVDLSHVSPDTMEDAIRVSAGAGDLLALVGARRDDVPRNVPDDVLQLLPKNGGVVMVTFVPGFLSPKVAAWNQLQTAEAGAAAAAVPERRGRREDGRSTRGRKANPAPRATIADVADHIDHIRKVAGIDHIGLGGDFDGITSVVAGARGRLEVPGADRGAAAPRLHGRRHQEDSRAEHPARDARGGEGVDAAAEGTRGLAAALQQVTRWPNASGSSRSATRRPPGRRDFCRRSKSPPPEGRRDEPVRVLADEARAGLGRASIAASTASAATRSLRGSLAT